MWRQGSTLVVPRKVALPPRCFKCGEPVAGRPMKVSTSYLNSLWLLLIFAGLLVYIIVALILRKTGTVHLYLCPRHRSRRRVTILVCWLLFLGCFPCFYLAATSRAGEWAALYAIAGIG